MRNSVLILVTEKYPKFQLLEIVADLICSIGVLSVIGSISIAVCVALIGTYYKHDVVFAMKE